MVVCDSGLRVVAVAEFDEPDSLELDAMVREPPPTVVTMVTPWALMLVTTSPALRVLVTRSPWALVEVMTSPAVRGLVSGAEVVAAPGLESSVVEPEAASVELAPGARGEVLVEETVVKPFSDPETTGDSVVTLPPGSVLRGVPVAIGATGVTKVVADADSDTSAVLLLSGTLGLDVVIVPLLGVCLFAKATMLLAIDASSLCKASAAVLSFSNMPWVNFFGE